jgi:hypothetical protein
MSYTISDETMEKLLELLQDRFFVGDYGSYNDEGVMDMYNILRAEVDAQNAARATTLQPPQNETEAPIT